MTRIEDWTTLKAKPLYHKWLEQFDSEAEAIVRAIWIANRLVKGKALSTRRKFYELDLKKASVGDVGAMAVTAVAIPASTPLDGFISIILRSRARSINFILTLSLIGYPRSQARIKKSMAASSPRMNWQNWPYL